MPLKVTIIGAAGTLGSCTAFRLVTLGLADELVLIDVKEKLLKSHLIDIETAVAGMHDVRLVQGTDEDMAGSDIVIVAAGAPWRVVDSRMEKLTENIPIIRDTALKLSRFCPQAVVITATNPVDPLNFALHAVSGIDRCRVLGYTLNDTTRFIRLAAQGLQVSARRLQGIVIGEHGDTAVLLFSSLRLDGEPLIINQALKDLIRFEHRNTLRSSIVLRTGWTSGWTSSVGLAQMVAAIARQSDTPIPCSIPLNGEYGIDGVSISVPVRLGSTGVREVIAIPLASSEAEELKNSADYLHQIVQNMDLGLPWQA